MVGDIIVNIEITVLFDTGGIGDWKNHMTVAENAMFDSVLEEWTAGKEIQFTYV